MANAREIKCMKICVINSSTLNLCTSQANTKFKTKV